MLARMSRLGIVAAALVSLALVVPSSLALASADPEARPTTRQSTAEELQGYVPGASALEGRIMAPCCWVQTIDIPRLRNRERPPA